MQEDFLSNAYLVARGPGERGFMVDAGAPPEPLLEAAERDGVAIEAVLLTHRHGDHVSEAAALRERLDVEVLAHPDEATGLDFVTRTIEPGEQLRFGGVEVEALHTPGHTSGMLSFRADAEVFTGDTLFKGSVGGVKAPGASGFADLRRSVMDVLMALPPETTVRPGHSDPTTVAAEWEQNPFVRLWRGLDEPGEEPCTVWERRATLVLWAPDYDGGHKAWIRWEDSGEDDIVPGSQVERG